MWYSEQTRINRVINNLYSDFYMENSLVLFMQTYIKRNFCTIRSRSDCARWVDASIN